MKMRLVVFLALFVLCKGDYPTAIPEVLTSSDSFGAPPEAPTDSYGPPEAPSDSYGAPVKAPLESYTPPAKVSLNVAPVQEILPAPVPEPIATEVVAAAPAQSASFNFLSELAAPPVVSLGTADTSLKVTPVVQQEIVSAPIAEQFQLNIPGLSPPIALPQTPTLPPVQVLPPIVPQTPTLPPVQFPSIVPQTPTLPPVQLPQIVPQTPTLPPVQLPPIVPQTPTLPTISSPVPSPVPSPIPVPIPVQPAPVQPVQTLALPSSPAPAPVTRVTAHEITVPRVRTAFIPQENFQIVLPSVTPFSYAPYFLHANTLPATFFSSRKVLPQFALNPQVASEVLNLQPQISNAVVETSAVKTAPNFVEAPSTSYGTPILETLQKKK